MSLERAHEVIVARVMEAAAVLRGTYRESFRGVPNVSCQVTDEQYASVCWFGYGRFWRVFYPCNEHGAHIGKIRRLDATDLDGVYDILATLGAEDTQMETINVPPEMPDDDAWRLANDKEG